MPTSKHPPARGLSPWPLPLAMAAALLAIAPLAQAQSLAELYDSARAFDANYQSARLQYDANLARAGQSRAGILPTVGLGASASHGTFDSDRPPVTRSFNIQNAVLNASQPLYRPANWAGYQQGKEQVTLARAQLDAAGQDLIVRTAQAYFDVLAAHDTLAFVQAQKAAVDEQLASARRNFEVGTSTITDTREAEARFDLVRAQEISADNDLRIKKIALDQLVGSSGAQPRGLLAPVTLPPLLPGDAEAWVQQAQSVHPGIRQAQSALDIAALEVNKAEAGHKPTLDLTASYNVQRQPAGTTAAALNSGFSTSSGLFQHTHTSSIALQLNVPLFAGFATQNRIRETLALKDKAQSDLEGARRTVALSTRTAYFGVLSGQGQVQALEAAERSSQSALEANQLGYQVGVRINIDVLNAQSQLYQTKRDLAQARYNVLLGALRLRQANGTLTPDDLLQINALLAR